MDTPLAVDKIELATLTRDEATGKATIMSRPHKPRTCCLTLVRVDGHHLKRRGRVMHAMLTPGLDLFALALLHGWPAGCAQDL
eukprot:scaffold317323_cov15-Tisochrysis_lutea.AAC.1